MSAHSVPLEMLQAPWSVVDPGNAGTIDLANKGRATCGVRSAGVETRVVPAPQAVGQELVLYCDTHAGNITCTVTSGVTGLATVTLESVGAGATLVAVSQAGAVRWQATRFGVGTTTIA